MTVEQSLQERSGQKCELCSNTTELSVYELPPNSDGTAEQCILTCEVCRTQINDPESVDPNHWRCLNDSMWSTVPAVQVMAWRMLNQLKSEGWPLDLLETLYLDEDTQRWAEALIVTDEGSEAGPTLDSNGIALNAGDNVTLIKDLVVKGGGFTAKRGTLVKNISLTSNPKHVEGRVNGTLIVLVAGFLKKAN
ncbi:MAG: PhnA domain-containing protein [Fuerstiella sp.]|jgi:protein PhnA